MIEGSFPPPGTKCADCGCCPAAVYAGNVPICWDCDAGTHKAQAAALATIPHAAPILLPAPDPEQMIDPEPEKHEAEPETHTKETPVHTPPSHIENPLTLDEIRAAILKEPHAASTNSLAKKYGITYYAVSQIRERAKEKAPAKRRAVPSPEAVAAQVAAPQPLEVVSSSAANISQPLTLTPISEPRRVAISLDIDEEGADAYWCGLNLDQKAWLIQTQMMAVLQRVSA